MRLRLTTDIEFDANSVPEHLLRQYITQVIEDAVQKRAFTGVSGAEVTSHKNKIDRLDNPTPQSRFKVAVYVRRRYQRSIAAPDAFTAQQKVEKDIERMGLKMLDVTELWQEDKKNSRFVPGVEAKPI